jgi:hypothetical protein
MRPLATGGFMAAYTSHMPAVIQNTRFINTEA